MSNTLNTESIKTLIHAHYKCVPIYTGIDEIDNLTKGIKSGQVIVIGGRPFSGKTNLALQIVSNIAKTNPFNMCYYSLELSKQQLIGRLIDMNNNDVKWLLDSDNQICDKYPLSLEDIENNIAELNSHFLLRIVIIDFIQRIQESKKKMVWDKLKSIAIKERIAVIVLSQLKRSFSVDYDKNRQLEYLCGVSPKPKKIDHVYLIEKFHGNE